jgi:membrane-associated phospholipid phosphatase
MVIDRPARTATLLCILTVCLATVLSILYVDRTAATWSHASFHGIAIFIDLTHIDDPIVPIAALGFLVIGAAAYCGWQPGPVARAFFCACVAVLVALMIKDQAKYAFGRLWPETWVNNNPSWVDTGAYGFFPFHGGAGWSSFPSGHMTAIAAPMVVFWRALPRRWRWLPLIPIALVALGLYGADYHFVSDMIAGTLLGTLCANIVYDALHGRDGELRSGRRSL